MTSMFKIKSKRSLAFILIAALCITMIPLMAFAGQDDPVPNEGTPANVTELVEIDNINVYHNGTLFISDGEFVESDPAKRPPVYIGDNIKIEVDFNISVDNCQKIKAGDFMEVYVPIPCNYEPESIGIVAKTVGSNPRTFGTFKTKGGYGSITLRVDFIDLSEFNGLTEGMMDVEGNAMKNDSGEGSYLILDYEVPKFVIGEKPKDDYLPGYGEPWLPNYYKNGWKKYGSASTLVYQVDMYHDNYKRALAGDSYVNPTNVLLEDTIMEGVDFDRDSIGIAYRVYMYSPTNKLTGYNMDGYKPTLKINLIDQCELVTQTASHDNYDSFKADVKATKGPSYGIYDDGKNETLVVNLGNIGTANSLKTEHTWAEMESFFDSYKFTDPEFRNVTDQDKAKIIANTKAAYKNLYGSATGTVPVPGVFVDYTTIVEAGTGSRDIKNTAIISSDSHDDVSKSITLGYVEQSIEAKELPYDSVKISKVDGDTKDAITGASFKLVHENGTETTVKAIDKKGEVQFDDLKAGKYTIEEVDRPAGYTDALVIYNEDDLDTPIAGNSFTITTNTEAKGYKFIAHNFKEEEKIVEEPENIKENPVVNEEVQGESANPSSETSTGVAGEEDVLGEEGTPVDEEDGSVLGEEAKTADMANMTPLLLMLAIVSLLLLLVSFLNNRRED